MTAAAHLQAARKHESNRLIELRNDRLKRVDAGIVELEHSLAVRRTGQSGQFAPGLLKIQQREMEWYIDQAAELRGSLIKDCDALASESEITRLRDQISREIDGQFQGILTSISRRGRGSGHLPNLASVKQSLKGKLQLKLNTVKSGATMQKAISKPPLGNTTVYSASHGAILNTGTIVNSHVSTNVHVNEMNDLARGIAGLAEAVKESQRLAEAEKKSALEILEFVAEQVAQPPEKRQKASVMRAAWNGLQLLLSACSNVAQIYLAISPTVHDFINSL